MIVAFRLLVYSLIDQIHVTFYTAPTKAHSHSLPSSFLAIITTIRLAILLLNPSGTVIIVSVTTHIYLPYMITALITSLYIITRALISAPVLPSTFATIPHILWYLCRLLYIFDQSLLLYVNVQSRYGNDVVRSRGFRLTLIST